MKLTKELLKEKNACSDGYEWYLKHGCDTVEETAEKLIADDRLNWANWLVTQFMDKNNAVRYAIFAASEVLHIFESKFPNDIRPRKAIEAAQAYLDNPSARTAAAAAAWAAEAAAWDAARAAAWAAAWDAARAAEDMKIKIINYGLKLLEAHDE